MERNLFSFNQFGNQFGRFLLLGLVLLSGVVSRIIPHPPGFVPVAALGLFTAYFFRSGVKGYLSVLGIMIVSDLLIGFDSPEMRAVVYGSLFFPAVLGVWLDGRNRSSWKERVVFAGSLGVSSLASSGFFFAITNFAVWLWSGMYEHTFTGLAFCYAAALPFLRNALAADLIYSFLFFGAYWIVLSVSHRHVQAVA